MTDLHRFGPKPKDHPSVGRACPACGAEFETGDYTTLVPTAPADTEERGKMLAGRAYLAEAAEVHWTCGSRLGGAE